MASEAQILQALSTVIDPDFKKDLVSLNMIKLLVIEGNHISFTIELTTPACPLKDHLEAECRKAIALVDSDSTLPSHTPSATRLRSKALRSIWPAREAAGRGFSFGP